MIIKIALVIGYTVAIALSCLLMFGIMYLGMFVAVIVREDIIPWLKGKKKF